jgi:hypothetical protein
MSQSGPGLFAAPYLELPELSLISNVKLMKKASILQLSPGRGQGNLTTLRNENWKIRHENEIEKANKRLHKV